MIFIKQKQIINILDHALYDKYINIGFIEWIDKNIQYKITNNV